VQNNDAALRGYVLTITQSLSLLTLPATLGLALVADDFVTAVLGPKWANSVLPLRILAVYSAVRAITSFFTPLLNTRGQSRFVMWNHILAALAFTAAFYLGSRWGIVGIALVWPLLYPFTVIPLFIRMINDLKLPLHTYVSSLFPALSGSLIMIVSLLILKSVIPARAIHARLAIEIGAGAAIYCVTIAGLYPGQLRRIYTLIRPATQAAPLAAERPV